MRAAPPGAARVLVGKWSIECRPSAHHEPFLTPQVIVNAPAFLGSLVLPWCALVNAFDLKNESRTRRRFSHFRFDCATPLYEGDDEAPDASQLRTYVP